MASRIIKSPQRGLAAGLGARGRAASVTSSRVRCAAVEVSVYLAGRGDAIWSAYARAVGQNPGLQPLPEPVEGAPEQG